MDSRTWMGRSSSSATRSGLDRTWVSVVYSKRSHWSTDEFTTPFHSIQNPIPGSQRPLLMVAQQRDPRVLVTAPSGPTTPVLTVLSLPAGCICSRRVHKILPGGIVRSTYNLNSSRFTPSTRQWILFPSIFTKTLSRIPAQSCGPPIHHGSQVALSVTNLTAVPTEVP
jgi:hypothetical protein